MLAPTVNFGRNDIVDAPVKNQNIRSSLLWVLIASKVCRIASASRISRQYIAIKTRQLSHGHTNR